MSAQFTTQPICLECGEPLTYEPGGRPSSRKFCDNGNACKTAYNNRKRDELKREEAALEPIKGLLAHLGHEQRELLLSGFAREHKRMTGQPRECRCNGSGIYDYDQDGDAFCRLCGGSVRAVQRDVSRGNLSLTWTIGKESHGGGRPRDLSEEWARAWRPGEKPTTRRCSAVTVTLKTGEEVVYASQAAFERGESEPRTAKA
jgi:hypothetical protein